MDRSDDYIELGLPGFIAARHYREVSSTMDVARDWIERYSSPELASALIVADYQTQGRGRQGRQWLSGEGAFMATFAFEVELPRAALSGYSLAVGVGIARAFRDRNIEVALKWPNDLVAIVEGSLRKLGGILVEVHDVRSRTYLLVGLGINVNPAPSDVGHIAVSLLELGSDSPRSSDLIRPIASRMVGVHTQFAQGAGVSPFLSEWRTLSAFRRSQTRLTIDLGAETISGVYVDIDSSGALLLSVDGTTRTVHSGHILEVKY